MAFTKAPEYNTHQLTKLLPQEYIGAAVFPNLSSDYYPVLSVANGYIIKERDRPVVYRAPPYSVSDLSPTVTSDGAWAFFWPKDAANTFWWANGEDLHIVNGNGTHSVSAASAFSTTNKDYEKAFTEYAVGSSYYVVATDRGATTDSYIRYFTSLGAVSTSATLTGIRLGPDIVFLDGYLFVASDDNNTTGKGRIYNSTLGTPTTWSTSTDFIDAEIEGDNIVGLAKHHNHLVAFGSKTIEFFYNAANELGSPLQRQSNYAKNIGLVGNHVTVGDIIYFLGVSGNQYGLYKMEKFNVTQIESPILDTILNRVSSSTLSGGGVQNTISAFNTEHGVAIVITYVSTFLFTLLYLPKYNTFSTFNYLYDNLGLAGNLKNQPLPNGNCILSINGVNNNVRAGRTVLSYNSSLTYPDLRVFFHNEGFDTDNQKHIKWVDANGKFRFDTNEITLFLSGIKGKDVNGSDSYTPFSFKDAISTPYDAPFRWRNLGRSRYHTFYLTVSGDGPVILENLEVAYNAGTH